MTATVNKVKTVSNNKSNATKTDDANTQTVNNAAETNTDEDNDDNDDDDDENTDDGDNGKSNVTKVENKANDVGQSNKEEDVPQNLTIKGVVSLPLKDAPKSLPQPSYLTANFLEVYKTDVPSKRLGYMDEVDVSKNYDAKSPKFKYSIMLKMPKKVFYDELHAYLVTAYLSTGEHTGKCIFLTFRNLNKLEGI